MGDRPAQPVVLLGLGWSGAALQTVLENAVSSGRELRRFPRLHSTPYRMVINERE